MAENSSLPFLYSTREELESHLSHKVLFLSAVLETSLIKLYEKQKGYSFCI